MKLALDIILVAIIAIAIWGGYKKGVIMGIGGIIVLIVALVLGNTLSAAYSPEVVTAMRPFAGGYTDKLLGEAVYAELGIEDSEYSLEDLLKQKPELYLSASTRVMKELGLSDDAAETLAMEAVRYTNENGLSLSDGLTETVCAKVAYIIGFLLFFALSAIVLTVVGNITNLSFRIPYLGIGNEIGGALMGLAEGIILCMVFAWALRFMGIVFPDGLLQETHLVKIFMEKNLLATYLGI